MPRLPAIIYGIISITCGIISLYVPETLNRPLPNSIDDVVKWPRSLSKEEKKDAKKQTLFLRGSAGTNGHCVEVLGRSCS